MSIAIYPGSFDPFTLGHGYIAERACCVFDRVIIAVAEETYKENLFTTVERVSFIRDATSHLANCEVEIYEGLTMDFALQQGAVVIVRGLRSAADYEYETQIAAIHKHLNADVETVFFSCDSRYAFVSSTAVKSLCGSGGKISGLVTPMVEAALHEKLLIC